MDKYVRFETGFIFVVYVFLAFLLFSYKMKSLSRMQMRRSLQWWPSGGRSMKNWFWNVQNWSTNWFGLRWSEDRNFFFCRMLFSQAHY